MPSFVKKAIKKIITFLKLPQIILEEQNKVKVLNCEKNVIKSDSSKFYEQAEIVNMLNDPSRIRIGENSHIRGHLQIFLQGGNIEIGDYCYVGEYSKIWSAVNIKIGNQVLISHNVNIHDNISHPINSNLRHLDYKRILGLEFHNIEKFNLNSQPIIIMDKVWVGFNSVILKGVTIGEGAIIGAGSVVTKDVPDWTIVAGNPAKVIREIPENER